MRKFWGKRGSQTKLYLGSKRARRQQEGKWHTLEKNELGANKKERKGATLRRERLRGGVKGRQKTSNTDQKE